VQIADRDTRHLRLGIGAAHRVGIDHREVEMGRCHQWLDAVAAADLERHDGAELLPEQRLLDFDGTGDVAAVGEPLLADQRRPMFETTATESSSASSSGDISWTREPSA
jgi:hypothetical protein